VTPDRICQAGQALKVLVTEDTNLPGKALTGRLDVRGSCHGKSKATGRSHRQPVKLVIGQSAVSVALLVGERRQHEAISHCWPARQRQWFK